MNKTNDFLIIKIKVILFLVKLINTKKSLYIDTLNRKNPTLKRKNLANIDKTVKMSNKNKKILDIKYILSKSSILFLTNQDLIFNLSQIDLN